MVAGEFAIIVEFGHRFSHCKLLFFSDRFDILDGNYCRNPGGIVDFPFCYTHAKNDYCRAELCDVSNLGKFHTESKRLAMTRN